MALREETGEMKTELCRVLHKIGSLKFGVFKLTSGRTSPYYIDLRIVPSFPDAFRKVCNLYISLVRTDLGTNNLERVAGIPTAGMPFASLVAYQLKKPFLYIRQHARLHGRERRIEGIIMPGDRVLLVDDLITTASSLRKAAKVIRAEGGIVNHALVLLDREEGGRQKLAEDGINLHYLLTASEAAKRLHEVGAIDDEQLTTILKQVRKK